MGGAFYNRVFAKKSGEIQLRTHTLAPEGYYNVRIRTKHERPNRLVLKAFKPIENDHRFEAHHIDGNPLNNDLSNLEWVKSGDHQRMHGRLRRNDKKRIKNEILSIYLDLYRLGDCALAQCLYKQVTLILGRGERFGRR